MSNSRELMDAFLSTYRPNLPEELVTNYRRVDLLQSEVIDLETQIKELEEKLKNLKKNKTDILKQVLEIKQKIQYNDRLKLDPECIFVEMQHSVDETSKIMNRSNRNDIHNLLLDIELLQGKDECHATNFVGAWAPIGKDTGDAIYKALLAEEGITLEVAERKLKELEALPQPSENDWQQGIHGTM